MRLTLLTPLLFLGLISASPEPQLAQGGGIAATVIAATPMATVTQAGSLFTINGVTSATWIAFTQTFASTALGTWDIGSTPLAGTIGLGSIDGTVGVVNTSKKKRGLDAVETPAPAV